MSERLLMVVAHVAVWLNWSLRYFKKFSPSTVRLTAEFIVRIETNGIGGKSLRKLVYRFFIHTLTEANRSLANLNKFLLIAGPQDGPLGNGYVWEATSYLYRRSRGRTFDFLGERQVGIIENLLTDVRYRAEMNRTPFNEEQDLVLARTVVQILTGEIGRASVVLQPISRAIMNIDGDRAKKVVVDSLDPDTRYRWARQATLDGPLDSTLAFAILISEHGAACARNDSDLRAYFASRLRWPPILVPDLSLFAIVGLTLYPHDPTVVGGALSVYFRTTIHRATDARYIPLLGGALFTLSNRNFAAGIRHELKIDAELRSLRVATVVLAAAMDPTRADRPPIIRDLAWRIMVHLPSDIVRSNLPVSWADHIDDIDPRAAAQIQTYSRTTTSATSADLDSCA